MKKLFIFIILVQLISTVSLAQNTYVPDDGFESKLIRLGYDSGPLDDYVLTANIENVIKLGFAYFGDLDLTGIEDFTALDTLYCFGGNITTMDLSQNLNLEYLYLKLTNLTNYYMQN